MADPGEFVPYKTRTRQTRGSGQTSTTQRGGLSSTKNSSSTQRTVETPGNQTTTRQNPATVQRTKETTPANVVTTTQTKPATTTVQRQFAHVGVQFSFSIRVTSLHPVDPNGGSKLVC